MRFVCFVLMTLFAAMALPAQTAAPGARHIAITLIPETATPASGSEVTLAFASVPEKGWHGYWENPGDAGVETTAAWTLPSGVTAGAIAYPVPHRLLISGLMNYVYEGPFALFVRLKVPAGLATGTKLPVAVKLDYLVCTEEVCVPESASLTTELTIGDGAIQPDVRARFDAWRRAVPKPLGSAVRFSVADGRIRIAVPYPAGSPATDAYFFPLTDGVIDYAAPQTVTRDDDVLTIATAAKGAATQRIEGVLSVGDGRGFAVSAVPGALPSGGGGGGGGEGVVWTLLVALGGAIVGGLILNVMPCVFPILSLKALSLAKSGGANARGEALGYTAGVIVTCLALGGALLVLRAGGASVGWAFQLTDPRVILILLLLVTAIAFNLTGLFELSAPDAVNRMAAGGTGGAFGTGALAAFVATPCTGPFMGAAMGTALILPWWGALVVFGGLGFGLALPFLLIGFVPALRRRLPKPGSWMETFRHILSIPMFLTALALAWVLGQQSGVDGMTIGLGAAALFAAGLWWTGVRQGKGRTRAWAPGALAGVLALGAMTMVSRAPAEARVVAGAEPFTEARLAALRAEGRPVFAYFTADWCVTCKVNEKAVIETAAVQDALGASKVAVLVGDWTDGDPALGRFIERHNRAGVPLYLWYAAGTNAPAVLPQILTKTLLTDLAKRKGETP
ncbi:protein-disulfide reductase DsbD family protein [Sphingomonas sp. RS2018]